MRNKPRFKVMDVAFGDNLLRPRQLILEVDATSTYATYTTCGETGGIGYLSESSLRTREEWLLWVDKFSDDLTGRQLREAKEAARADFIETKHWLEFRARYSANGDPWLK